MEEWGEGCRTSTLRRRHKALKGGVSPPPRTAKTFSLKVALELVALSQQRPRSLLLSGGQSLDAPACVVGGSVNTSAGTRQFEGILDAEGGRRQSQS